MKYCKGCGETKQDCAFARDKSQKDGLCQRCRECMHYVYLMHREKNIENAKKYRNKDKFREYHRNYQRLKRQGLKTSVKFTEEKLRNLGLCEVY